MFNSLYSFGEMADTHTGSNFEKRDALLNMEHEVRKWWDESNVFNAEAQDQAPKEGEKFFGTFPFPYMNGHLHLGHAFSLSKLEFAAAYHRMKGANVLLPFAFHCTGMPIKASADKLKTEIENFGYPPVFPSRETVNEPKTKEEKLKGKKSKVASKTGREVYQWEIMRSYGLSDAEIAEFQEPVHWLHFFPPFAVEDLKAFGLGADWRRSFITTEENPFFDKFVRWQMRKLKSLEKIVEDERYTIYSPLDGQPCADHDRASGEGVKTQEYTLIKLEVVPPFPFKFARLEGKKVYLAAATLRPETVYGLTNAWVKPDGKYGAFEINESDVFILTERAARNLAFQKMSPVPGEVTCLVNELTGQDLTGLRLQSPFSVNKDIYCLPMLSVRTDKGTGIVPSDSPDDFMALQDSKAKAAKKNLNNKLVENKQAVIYSEPEEKVMSRSGDECVVALTKQWYLKYGESDWLKAAKDCLKNMNLYPDKTRGGFERTLDWLEGWACSRSFGLGTHMPWAEEFLVDSLSDSTIYMAYYTVCHLLQNGDIFGKATSSSLIKPEQLTDDVWEYIFRSGSEPELSDDIAALSLVKKMRREFQYWYPVDLRVSGKDLIQNHLTFCIYNHTAIFPKEHWPRGFRCNGHIMLNSKKMSKSTGNFKTLKEAIEEFSADATRFSLADAGDGMDDANFAFDTANAAILRLAKERVWMEEALAASQWSSFRVGPPLTFADRVFANEINFAVITTEKNYSGYMFREALKTGFYDLQAARNEYRDSCGGSSGMNRDLLWRFMDVQTRLITPICPHYAEYVWRKVLKKQGFVIKAGWPEAENPDLTLQEANKYLHDSITDFRKHLNQASKKGKPTTGLIFVKEEYDGWKKECLNILKDKFDSQNRKFAPDQEILEALQQSAVRPEGNIQKLCMPFLKLKKNDVMTLGIQALDLRLPFSEIQVLQENLELIKRQIGLQRVEILSATDVDAAIEYASFLKKDPPSPGYPTSIFTIS
ncbi:hypothetical protein QVD17_14882 [Tagetes erecta]|uniref:leucine--tRNA ligase n=1 Tax=Tagetes erecta TaxID=13708 RepID=A0AAD8NY79_TARER|nr:hypothetical protein QVD17_14882 [Tagetes erecta]